MISLYGVDASSFSDAIGAFHRSAPLEKGGIFLASKIALSPEGIEPSSSAYKTLALTIELWAYTGCLLDWP